MKRDERIEKWAVIGVKARSYGMFGVWHVMDWLKFAKSHRTEGYHYRLALKIINEMADAGLVEKYTTNNNENVYLYLLGK